MDGGVLERPGPVPGGLERAHEAERHARVEQVVRRPCLPPLRRAAEVPLPLGALGEGLERTRVGGREPLPLAGRPALELRRVGQEEAVEEGAGVEPDRPRELAAAERVLEVAHVAAHPGSVEAHHVPGADQRVLPQCLAEHVKGVGEQVPPALLVRLRPEVGGQLVAGHTAAARRGQQREQRQAVTLGRATGQRTRRPLERGASEELEGEQLGMREKRVTEAGERGDEPP